MKHTGRLTKILYYIVLVSLLGSTIFIITNIFLAPVQDRFLESRSKADYVLMLLQCLLGLVVIHLPSFVERRFSFEIPNFMITFYLIFLYCAIYLGEVRSFYYLIPQWDTWLHAMSAASLATLGFSFVSILNRMDEVQVNLSPAFVALFAFCFAVTLGALWELYEFTGDGMFGVNMQKYITADGTVLSGHEALRDTMKDILVDMIGAFASSLLGYFFIKNEPREKTSRMVIRRKKESSDQR